MTFCYFSQYVVERISECQPTLSKKLLLSPPTKGHLQYKNGLCKVRKVSQRPFSRYKNAGEVSFETSRDLRPKVYFAQEKPKMKGILPF